MTSGINNNFLDDYFSRAQGTSRPAGGSRIPPGSFNQDFWQGFNNAIGSPGDSFQYNNINEAILIQKFVDLLLSNMQIQENTPFTYGNNNNTHPVTSIKGKSPEFIQKVNDISARINCDPRDLIAVMKSESGLNAQAKNPNSTATGLIQFMGDTAKSLGTTTAKLRQMSDVEQLDYVEKYLARTKAEKKLGDSKLNSGQLYALVFMPSLANGGSLKNNGQDAFRLNKGLDMNKDNMITVDDLAIRLQKYY